MKAIELKRGWKVECPATRRTISFSQWFGDIQEWHSEHYTLSFPPHTFFLLGESSCKSWVGLDFLVFHPSEKRRDKWMMPFVSNVTCDGSLCILF